MRSLVVAQLSPWTKVIGARLRLQRVIGALSELGPVDVYVVARRPEDVTTSPPATSPVARFGSSARPPSRRPRRWAAVASGRLPTELAGRDYRGVQAAFARWQREPYDLVWFSRPISHVALGPALDGVRAIVDLDDLEDLKIAARLQPGLPRSMRAVRDRHDAWLWRRLQRRIARNVSAVVVCSEYDRGRLGLPNVAVVDNGYDPPEQPQGRLEVGQPPTLLFQGNLLYRPNVAAAQFLVADVMPLIRGRLPGVRLRLVGDAAPGVHELSDPPAVTVTGFVPSMEPELARADAVVVPIPFGGGTRVKILEAFAHRIPVVSTRIGAEGLDVEAERHLALADGAADLADACVRVLTDVTLRRRFIEEAQRLHLERYTSRRAMDAVRDLASTVVSSTSGAART